MTDKKLTDEEIIKALTEDLIAAINRYSAHLENGGRIDENQEQYIEMLTEIINLINRQRAEIERLKEYIKRCKSGEEYWVKCLLDKPNEAYKEFAEEIKEEIENAYNNNSKVLSKHMSKYAECPNYEFIATVQGKMNTLRGLDDFIDDLLKKKGVEKT